MAENKVKQGITSSMLDFEEVNEFSFSPADFITAPEEATPLAETPAMARAVASAAPPPKPTPVARKPVKQAAPPKDNFARYAAIFALIGFAFLFAGVLYVKTTATEKLGQAYVILPKVVANVNGQVVRMQVTIQVEREDERWLLENQKVLKEIFQIEAASINAEDLHTEEGMAAIQERFKSAMNKSLRVDKIQSVLLTELLTQNRE